MEILATVVLGRGRIDLYRGDAYEGRPKMAKWANAIHYTADFGANHDNSHSGICANYNEDRSDYTCITDIEEAEQWIAAQWAKGYVGTFRR